MKHNYSTEDLLLYMAGEGSEAWRNELREVLHSDREMLLQFREMRTWDRFLNRLRFSPSVRATDSIRNYARQSMVIALC